MKGRGRDQGARRASRFGRGAALPGLLVTVVVASAGCEGCGQQPPGADGGSADGGAVELTITSPRPGTGEPRAVINPADDVDPSTDGIQIDVEVAVSGELKGNVTLTLDSGDATDSRSDGEVGDDGGEIVFRGVTIPASAEGIDSRLSVSADGAVGDEVDVRGVLPPPEDPFCLFTSPLDGDTVADADDDPANGFQIAVSVRCGNVDAGEQIEVRAEAGPTTGTAQLATLAGDGSGNVTASLVVDAAVTGAANDLIAELTSDRSVAASISVMVPPNQVVCDAQIVSPADGATFDETGDADPSTLAYEIDVELGVAGGAEGCAAASYTLTVGEQSYTGTLSGGSATQRVEIIDGVNSIEAVLSLDGVDGASDTASVTLARPLPITLVGVTGCALASGGCFNASVDTEDPSGTAFAKTLTIQTPAVNGSCPGSDPVLTVDGGTELQAQGADGSGGSWTLSGEVCEASFGVVELHADLLPDEVVKTLVVSITVGATVVGRQVSLGVDRVAPTLTWLRPNENQLLNVALDALPATPAYDVRFSVSAEGLPDLGSVAIALEGSGGATQMISCASVSGLCQTTAVVDDGTWTATATGSDAAGNPATPAQRSFRVDGTAPAVSSITVGADADDGGVINLAENGGQQGAVVTSVTVTLTGLESGRTVSLTVSPNGGVFQAAVDADGNAQFSNVTLSEGERTLQVSGTDAGGNAVLQDNASRAYLVDTTPPTVTIFEPNPDVKGILIADDDLQPAERLQVQFVVLTDAEDGQVVRLEDANASQTLLDAQAVSMGSAVFPMVTLEEGTRAITASVSDAAGNEASSAVYAPIVDTEPPLLTIASPTPGFVLSQANDADGDVSNGLQTSFLVEHQALEAGQTIAIVSDIEGVVGQAATEADGTTQIQVTFLESAQQNVHATALDINGNEGTSASQSITTETGLYTVRLLSPPDVGGVRRIGIAQDDDPGTPTVAEVTIEVQVPEALPPGTVIQLLIDGAPDPVATASQRTNGDRIYFDRSFADGEAGTLEITVDDLQGKLGTTGQVPYATDLDRPSVSFVGLSSPVIFNRSDDLQLNTAGLQTSVTVEVGNCENGSVRVRRAAQTIGGPRSVDASGTGDAIQVSLDVSDPEHGPEDWTAECTDITGNVGTSTSITTTVDVTAPAAPALTVTPEHRRRGLLRIEFSEPGDDGNGGGDVASLEVVASKAAINSDAAFDAVLALPGGPTTGGLLDANILGVGSTRSIVTTSLAYDTVWTLAMRAIDDAGNATIVSTTNGDLATTLIETTLAEDDTGAGAAVDDGFAVLAYGHGDLNGDGFEDLVVGADREGDNCNFGFCDGTVRIFGGAANLDGVLDPTGVIAMSEPSTLLYGTVGGVAVLPSIDGDEFDELAVYALDASTFQNVVFLYYGTDAVDGGGSPLFVDRNSVVTIRFGRVPRPAGDVNGDGFQDFAIGESTSNGDTTVLVFGSSTRMSGEFDPLGGGFTNGAILTAGTSGSARLGHSIAALGNLDGDGVPTSGICSLDTECAAGEICAQGLCSRPLDDLVLGGAEQLFVVRGRASWPVPPATFDVGTLDATDVLSCPGANCGNELSAGDVNGDGARDLLALEESSVAIYLAAGDTLPASRSYRMLAGANVVRASSGGLSVGDINGDGFADVLLTKQAGTTPSSVKLFYGDERSSGDQSTAGVSYPLDIVAADGATVGFCGDLDGAADGLPELCYASRSGTGALRVRY